MPREVFVVRLLGLGRAGGVVLGRRDPNADHNKIQVSGESVDREQDCKQDWDGLPGHGGIMRSRGIVRRTPYSDFMD